MKRFVQIVSAIAVAMWCAVFITSCTSDADKASENISIAAEQFEVQRKIVGINSILDTPAFEVEGRCSIETSEAKIGGTLEVICRHAANDYRRHNLGPSDNVYWVAIQLAPIDVSVYHTRIVVKPENLIPEFDLETGDQ